ncbi:radical SAM protein [bacterium]|nr:radical SAM protein [bacterium]
MEKYLEGLKNCNLCEWKCGVNRLEGETGVCGIGKPKIATAALHPAPPQSYTIFLCGCNFKCLGCQNWTIAHYPKTETRSLGFIAPEKMAEEAVEQLNSSRGNFISADRIFFSGGSPTPSLPYIEKIVEEARKIQQVKVNYDTNGFMTHDSLKRILHFVSSITFDIKAFSEEIHRSLTGAPSGPVLRNAKYVAENALNQLWEFRYMLIPEINEEDVKPLAKFFAEINPHIPLNFLAFRPNFVLEKYKGATQEKMEMAVKTAKDTGLKNVDWSGQVGLKGKISEVKALEYTKQGARLAGGIAKEHGCITHPRNCGICDLKLSCPIKSHTAARTT